MSGRQIDLLPAEKKAGVLYHLPAEPSRMGQPRRRSLAPRCGADLRGPFLVPNISEWRLELRAREAQLEPCPACVKLRPMERKRVPMHAHMVEALDELAAYIDVEHLENPAAKHADYLLRLAKALNILRTEKPLGMVWAGQTGASARWVPTRNGGRVAWMIGRHKGDWPVSALLDKHRPPTAAELAKKRAA